MTPDAVVTAWLPATRRRALHRRRSPRSSLRSADLVRGRREHLDHCGTELLRLLERHVVRGLLEPDHPLRGRVEPFEVGRGEACVDLAVEAAEEEEHRHRE